MTKQTYSFQIEPAALAAIQTAAARWHISIGETIRRALDQALTDWKGKDVAPWLMPDEF